MKKEKESLDLVDQWNWKERKRIRWSGCYLLLSPFIFIWNWSGSN